MPRLLSLLIVLAAAVVAAAAEPGPFDDPAALAAAQAKIDAGIRAGVEFDAETHELVIDSSAAAAPVTAPCTFDVQWGSGHGGSLTFVRFSIGRKSTSVEQLSYRTDRRKRPASWTARRAELTTESLAPLVQLARAEARTTAKLKTRPDSTRLGGGFSSSSADFFVLSRVLDGDRKVFEREYCGHAGSRGQRRYAGIQVVVRAVRKHLDALTSWVDVPAGELRTTHWTAAFGANVDLMLEDFHWWLMERSVEGLGVFGTAAALPTLSRLDRDYPEPQPRQRAKIRNVLGRSDHYLRGDPKSIPERPDARRDAKPEPSKRPKSPAPPK